MNDFMQRDYKVFEMFDKQMPIVNAGNMENFNGCTLGWGSLGNVWTRTGNASPIVTVYVYPSRYTCDFLKANDTFTLSFLPGEYRKAIGYMGSHSGREGDKARAAGLTPIPFGDSVTYAEAELTFLCKKLYQHPFVREDLHPDIRQYYQAHPKSFQPDKEGNWQTHYMFIGEIIDVLEKAK